MATFFCELNGESHGPINSDELISLAQNGKIGPETLVWKEGSGAKHKAGSIQGLFPEKITIPFPETKFQVPKRNLGQEESTIRLDSSDNSKQGNGPEIGMQSIQAAKGQAAKLLEDLKGVNFREEVTPINQELISTLSRDVVFWSVTALAIIPLLIATIEKREYQLTAFAMFFAALWGVIFKLLIVRAEIKWSWLISSMLFTGIVGIQALLYSYRTILPESYQKMAASSSGVTSLIGFVFQVGICEEFIKCIPVIAYLFWKGKQADPLGAVLIGVFSGLGFAAFENMSYGESSVINSAILAKKAGLVGAMAGTYNAMVNVMLRSLSLVFCHAVWSGIFAYFITSGFATGSRIAALFVIGLAVSSVLHGVYDWLTAVQMTFAALVVAGSYILFYAYLTKFRISLNAQ